MQVLNLLYTDPDLSTLLCWGQEGKEWVAKNLTVKMLSNFKALLNHHIDMVTLMCRVEVVVTRNDFLFNIRYYVRINFHMTKVQKITN